MKQSFFLGLVGLVMLVPTSWAQTRLVGGGSQIQVGRYTTQSAKPPAELSDPLAIYAQLNYPRQTVETVGQAIDYTLMRTGYRLIDIEALGDSARRFLSLPLPESQRSMGPYQVKTLLQTLLGSAWIFQSDPVTRQVWFEREEMVTPSAPSVPKASAPQAAPVEAAPETVEPAKNLSWNNDCAAQNNCLYN